MIIDSFSFTLKLMHVVVLGVGLAWPQSPREPDATAARPLLAMAAAPRSDYSR